MGNSQVGWTGLYLSTTCFLRARRGRGFAQPAGLGGISSSRRGEARACLFPPRPKPAPSLGQPAFFLLAAQVPERETRVACTEYGSVNPAGASGGAFAAGHRGESRAMYDEAGLSEARGARRVTGRGSEGGPPGARLAERRCAALAGPAAAWAGGHPGSTTFFLSRRFRAGTLRSCFPSAPPGSPGGARERGAANAAPTTPNRGANLSAHGARPPQHGADPSAHGADPSRVGKGPFSTRGRGFPTWERTLHEQGEHPSRPGKGPFPPRNGPFTSKDRGGCTFGMYPSQPGRAPFTSKDRRAAPSECTLHDLGQGGPHLWNGPFTTWDRNFGKRGPGRIAVGSASSGYGLEGPPLPAGAAPLSPNFARARPNRRSRKMPPPQAV